MAATNLPVNPLTNTPLVTAETLTEELQIEAIVAAEMEELAREVAIMDKYRRYYDGEQLLVFGTERFKERFKDAFKGFRDNWCAVVVDAIMDKMSIKGVLIPDPADQSQETREIGGGDGDGETATESQFESIARQIWEILSNNDIDEQQKDLYEGMFVEGRAAVIVWPDDELVARVDWNPAQVIKVRYSEEDWRDPILAIKRWVTPSGVLRVTVYTKTEVRKYYQSTMEVPEIGRAGVKAIIPKTTPNGNNLQKYLVAGEDWPLPNPLNEIPVVEFRNKRGSELTDIITIQDAINYLLISNFVGGEFQAFPQRVFLTGADAPEGGWDNTPGNVWKLPPMYDADGNLHFGEMGEFSAADLSGGKSTVEMLLQHVALMTKTPVRFFFKSDRSGRGDAPSGDSLLIEDEPLIDKTEDRETRAGNSWYRVSRLIAKCMQIQERLPPGEVIWEDPRSKYRAALLEEAKTMWEIGIPLEFIVGRIGLEPEEIVVLKNMLAEEKLEAEQEAEEAKQLALTQAANPSTNNVTNQSANSSST